MKKAIYTIIVILTVIACKNEEPQDYFTFSGKITNPNIDSLRVISRKVIYKKYIKVNKDGTFRDTIKVKDDNLSVFYGTKSFELKVKKGNNIYATFDSKEIDETLKFSGKGSEVNNLLVEANLLKEDFLFNNKAIFKLERKKFNAKLNSSINKFIDKVQNTQNIDSTFILENTKSFNAVKDYLNQLYEEKHYLATKLNVGTPSPKFSNYENYAGGETSLDDLKGKYVYIDLWATWCGPCKIEFPFLKKLEKDFHNKNIAFVSISIDNPKDYEKWRHMIKDEDLGGIQLYAKGNENFASAYKVQTIPRFILIDPQGNIVSPDAPRPSDPKLVKLFNDLKI